MTQAKERYGHAYSIAGGDGIHPQANGHLVMAYAILKAIVKDGQIGQFTVTLDGKPSATATVGHVVKSFENGTLTIESSRYPFCFLADPDLPHRRCLAELNAWCASVLVIQ